ncbi:hypothetical protein [Pectobacterium jejuense]|uniref:hypothetical protein n=1 Tax=Pectobacterium jejuense TaxID=2974022 RepID=UPI002280C520|nr:hypothetical protein [Pectobacterium jejuense]MCY9847282.1 hypothetical protein [Pectobacterium jejuense]
MIKSLYRYIALLLYSCLFFILMLLSLGIIISSVYYFSHGVFNFPKYQVERAVVFGSITGVAAWLGILIFKLLDKFKKKPHSDPK